MPPKNDQWTQYEVKAAPGGPAPKKDEWSQYEVPGDAQKKPLPLLPRDLTGAATELVYGNFLPQLGKAAKSDVSSAFHGLKQKANDALQQLKEDPSRIVPMWFGGVAGVLESAGRTVVAPVEAAAGGNPFDALSLAAGGDPKAAKEYASKGDNGGEFWEMLGKPLAMIAGGEVTGRVGGAAARTLAARSNDASLALMRDVVMRGSLDKTGIDMTEVQLARDAMQDAAQDRFGKDAAQSGRWKQLAPKRSFLAPVTRPEEGNQQLLSLSRHAVDLAGEPADKVNAVFGYMDGRQEAQNIRADLLNQAAEAERNGAHSYASALRVRAGVFDRLTHRGTLGEIYSIKKTANRLSDVARNTQEAIDLMDSYSAMASAIRREVYPIYERNIESVSLGQGFSLAQAGRKEGAAMSFRNGLEKSWRDAQERTGQIYRSGKPGEQVARGMSPRHATTGIVGRVAEKTGVWPNPQGALNQDVTRGIGMVPTSQARESLELASPAQFGVAPAPRLALPGRTLTFKIPAGLPVERQEGELLHSARQASRHSFEPPAYTTSTAPTRTAIFTPQGKPVAGPEGSMGADIRTARPPAPRSDIVGGGGVLETGDPEVAQNALDRMKASLRKNPRQPGLQKAVNELSSQLYEYWEAQRRVPISHTPPTMKYTPRQLAPERKPAKAMRRSLPAPLAGIQREESNGNPTDAWSNPNQ